MRVNIAVSLLHSPKLVYLDEPTIGLDIVAKARIRDFILEVNRKMKTTFILTTHDMADIESVCERLILINYGKLMYDGTLAAFQEEHGDNYTLVVNTDDALDNLHPDISIAGVDGTEYRLNCDKKQISIAEAVTFVTSHYNTNDIKIIEIDIESILKGMYETAHRG